MDKKQVTEALKKIKETSPKRKFTQSVDLIINLKNIDLKKTEQRVDFFMQLAHPCGKTAKICALIGPELRESAKACDEAVLIDNFPKYTDKKLVKKLAVSYDYFVAQATLMKDIATTFGRVFGPKGKMPNPKVGCVVPPNANLAPLCEKLKNTVRLRTINDPVVRCLVGKEDMKDEDVIENIMNVYDQVTHHLPNGKHNVKDICLKLTMGPAVKVGEKVEEEAKEKNKPKALSNESEKLSKKGLQDSKNLEKGFRNKVSKPFGSPETSKSLGKSKTSQKEKPAETKPEVPKAEPKQEAKAEA